jgi:hypothetical protein
MATPSPTSTGPTAAGKVAGRMASNQARLRVGRSEHEVVIG